MNTSTKTTWRELEAQGVKRCCGIFTSGKRCRKRAVAEFDCSWCATHGPVIKKHTDFAIKAINAQQAADDSDCD